MELRNPPRSSILIPAIFGSIFTITFVFFIAREWMVTGVIITLFVYVLVILAPLLTTYTVVARINNDQLEIEYIKGYKKKYMTLHIADVTLSLTKRRYRKNRETVYVLYAYEHSKFRHNISSNEGYTMAEFAAFIQHFTLVKERLSTKN
ncbi:hypothetical protein SAMN05518672_102603 [Chitinophaga sp. CF118]|uniref:hypothetical protein n=1 Tax=Chitinophaga sp. CF118 TaxID=1884367 RepID=UPI0008EB78A7|nr:hypothetical protein [Chitinophaga sp. CF118]SFD60966.1 hypothetical protein SAMN05518672_102603 [Chitinophaga sp. CF118]